MPDSPALSLTVDKRSRLRLHEQLGVLAMTPREKRRLVMSMARTVRKDARQNISRQRTIDGSPMAARKESRNKRKLLRKLGKGLNVYGRSSTRAEVAYSNAMTGKIAARHQHGIGEPWSTPKARKVYGVPDYKAPATRDQAKALAAEGYRLRVRKKRGKGCTLKRVSQKWIRDNLTVGQAGLILRIMRNRRASSGSWTVTPKARPFLGVPAHAADEMLADLARQTIKQLKL